MRRRQNPSIGVDSGASARLFAEASRFVPAAATDDEIWLWNVEQERRAGVLKGHVGKVKPISFSPDGKLVSLGSDNTVRLWSVRPNEALLVINTLTSEAHAPSASSTAPGGPSTQVELATPLSGRGQEEGKRPVTSEGPVGALRRRPFVGVALPIEGCSCGSR